MPIANCVITPNCRPVELNLIELWAAESGYSKDHMTINIITSAEQLGKVYSVMGTLWLPSLWSKESISSLQLGLVKALAEKYSLSLNDVHVMTHLVQSGFVVESGVEVNW